MVVCQRVFSLNEIAAWFDKLTMSGGRRTLKRPFVGFKTC